MKVNGGRESVPEMAPKWPVLLQCPKVRWRQCEACQWRIQEEGLEDEFHLQSWFVGPHQHLPQGSGPHPHRLGRDPGGRPLPWCSRHVLAGELPEAEGTASSRKLPCPPRCGCNTSRRYA